MPNDLETPLDSDLEWLAGMGMKESLRHFVIKNRMMGEMCGAVNYGQCARID